jgi:hypothetical protein
LVLNSQEFGIKFSRNGLEGINWIELSLTSFWRNKVSVEGLEVTLSWFFTIERLSWICYTHLSAIMVFLKPDCSLD